MTKRTLTPVFDGAKDLPVRVGWYLCWPKNFGDAVPKKAMRRFWNGGWFSFPIKVGESDQSTTYWAQSRSTYLNHELYWCGLTAPYES